MSKIHVHITSTKPSFTLDVAEELPGSGITGIFGTSGSGKTTLLRCIAGLEKADTGFLEVNGEIWQSESRFLPTHKRKLGYVFQEASLFAHLSIEKNLEYGWKRTSAARRKVTFKEVCNLLELRPYLQRYPAQLSGGQRQRVAIARALLTSPNLLLMDEPLSNLDIQSKTEILPYLEKLHDETSIPILYVSHSPDEIVQLADHLLCLEEGKVLASGEINSLLTRTDLPLANLEQACSIMNCHIKSHEPDFHVTHLAIDSDQPQPTSDLNNIMIPHRDIAIGKPVRIRILARDVSLVLTHSDKTSISNILPAVVVDVSPSNTPFQVLVRLDIQGQIILSKITQRSCSMLDVKPGLNLFAQVKSVALVK